MKIVVRHVKQGANYQRSQNSAKGHVGLAASDANVNSQLATPLHLVSQRSVFWIFGQRKKQWKLPPSTRSEALAPLDNIPTSKKSEESEKKFLSRQRNLKNERSALIDISNDSPIVELAGGSLESPLSFLKKRERSKTSPGSGEAKLRGQVKTLLQKVEEEAELSKLSLEDSPFLHLPAVLVDSPSGLLAPTLLNKPRFPNLSCY
ncbi:hypothetical protein NE237_016667 [Protea cynaroides]|uniref:Uncharacterized protein n=1 Tax=Protea cynaroides TaxID=273540 RepID=A0A9Q0K732_9MAGN|nr:hypothetical protein NE237_016667 [Protea cynaroides]